MAGRRRVPRPDGAAHRRAFGAGGGLPRDRAPSWGADHVGRPRRAGTGLQRHRRADPGRPPGRRDAARPRQAAAEGHRPPRAPLPARRRRAADAVPAGANGAQEPARPLDRDRGGERSRARRRRGGDHCYSRRLGLGYRLRRSDLGRRGGDPESPDRPRDRPGTGRRLAERGRRLRRIDRGPPTATRAASPASTRPSR